MSGSAAKKTQSSSTIFVAAVVIIYLVGYLVLRQTATRGTIFTTRSGRTIPQDFRAIMLSPAVAMSVYQIYRPLLMLDLMGTGTVVTVNLP